MGGGNTPPGNFKLPRGPYFKFQPPEPATPPPPSDPRTKKPFFSHFWYKLQSFCPVFKVKIHFGAKKAHFFFLQMIFVLIFSFHKNEIFFTPPFHPPNFEKKLPPLFTPLISKTFPPSGKRLYVQVCSPPTASRSKVAPSKA